MSNKIKEVRTSKSMSRRDMKALTGIDVHRMSRYENGQKVPNVETMKKIADALGVTISELVE